VGAAPIPGAAPSAVSINEMLDRAIRNADPALTRRCPAIRIGNRVAEAARVSSGDEGRDERIEGVVAGVEALPGLVVGDQPRCALSQRADDV
jgi:hypothetical protein